MKYFHSDLTPPPVTGLLRRVAYGLLLAAVWLPASGVPPAHAQVELLQSWARPYNPNTYRQAVAPFPFFQLVHHAGVGAVDVYVDDRKLLDNFTFQQATPYVTVWWGTRKIDFVHGDSTSNSHPIWSDRVTFDTRTNYALVAIGRLDDDTFDVLVLEDLPLEARNPDRVEYALVHAAHGLPAVDLRLLDPLNSNRVSALLANNLPFGGFRGYGALDPIGYNFQVTTADNAKEFDVFHYEFQGMDGETFLFLITPGATDSTLALLGIDVFGDIFLPVITTATEDAAAVPEKLALQGNYPNPFNPSTTIAFDLPETARVSVEIIDPLGRTVMTTPAQQIEAGAARTLHVDASALASGAYLYRVIAQTPTRSLIKTGQMVLIR